MRIQTEDDRRLERVFELTYEMLRRKINGGAVKVDNEASLQLQFSAILKTVGELFEVDRDEHFFVELEKPVLLSDTYFGKSGSKKAKIDIWYGYKGGLPDDQRACAVELKYFKKDNHREPNNRYDVFADLKNLESYGGFADLGFMLVATDHPHYVSQPQYSNDTGDFDFRHGRHYIGGTSLCYRTAKPYGAPIRLSRSYDFRWDTVDNVKFLKLRVLPAPSPQFLRLFADEPDHWGLRGDQPLWKDMAEYLVGTFPFPANAAACQEVLEVAFEKLTGAPIAGSRGPVLVEKYSSGGLSTGQVDPCFWREHAIPLLLSRFRTPSFIP